MDSEGKGGEIQRPDLEAGHPESEDPEVLRWRLAEAQDIYAQLADVQDRYARLGRLLPEILEQGKEVLALVRGFWTPKGRLETLKREQLLLQGKKHRQAHPDSESSTIALEAKLRGYEEKIRIYKDHAFDFAVRVLLSSPVISREPFIYLGVHPRMMYFTDVTSGFLGVSEAALKGCTNFGDLLKFVDPKFVEPPIIRDSYGGGRKGLRATIEDGDPLSCYEALTSGKPPVQLYLTSVPVQRGGRFYSLSCYLNNPPEQGKDRAERVATDIFKTAERVSAGMESLVGASS
jgi:hypothetical protein